MQIELPLCAEAYKRNMDRFSGFASLYDRFRSVPPRDLARLLAGFGGPSVATLSEPALVVDLGSGTDLSTRY